MFGVNMCQEWMEMVIICHLPLLQQPLYVEVILYIFLRTVTCSISNNPVFLHARSSCPRTGW